MSTRYADVMLAHGDVAAARRWADEAVAATAGSDLAMALTTRARVAIAQGEPEQAERDAREALAVAAAVDAHLIYPGRPGVPCRIAGARRQSP